MYQDVYLLPRMKICCQSRVLADFTGMYYRDLGDRSPVELDDKTITSIREQAPEDAKLASNRVIANHYEVIERIGAGGMSTVYKVRHLHLDRTYALKLLQKVDKDSLQRFQQEGKASSLLEHPNIVSIHDFGVTDEQPYMLMDFCEGKSLSHLIREEKRLEPGRAIFLFEQIASALSHAHSRGVIHRDVKPSNIMIVRDNDGTERAILVDFGIAKLIPLENIEEQQKLTQTGDVFGTPLYMSPEQCLGHTIDAKTDIYSLACVLYEVLTGSPPFSGDSVYEIVYKQINDAPKPFPEDLRKTQVGRNLEVLVLKGMAKLPQNRHRFALEMAVELKQSECPEGLVGKLKSFFALLSGRQKASESNAVLQSILFRTECVLALIIACNLFFLPPYIATTKDKLSLNKKISKTMSDILPFKFKLGKLVNGDDEGLIEKLHRLESLCLKSDAHMQSLYRKFRSKVSDAISGGTAFTADYKDNMMALLTQSDALVERFDLAMARWNSSYEAGNEITKLSNECSLNYKNQLSFLGTIYSTSLYSCPLIFVALLWSLRQRHLTAKSRRNLSLPARQASTTSK